MNARTACTALLALASAAAPLHAQSVRLTAATTIRYIELRPLLRDSVAATETAGSELLRQLADGRVVRCIPGEEFCRDTRAGPRTSTVPMIHDIDVSAWGIGEGIRLYAQLRARNAVGLDRELWPRGDDGFEMLALYGEYERERVRVRAGRQWKVSGLGFYNFDGVAVALRPVASASLELYGGRSLLRGLNETRTGGALESIEALAPPSAGLLFGVHGRYRPSQTVALSTMYQVDFRTDGRGLFSELAAADAVVRIGAGSIEAALEVDAAAGALNEARLRVRAPPLHATVLHAELRRYRPYFELWTIWGAFSPVGFDEAQVGATWASAHGAVIVRGSATYRGYGDTGAAEVVAPVRDSGWGVSAALSWSPLRAWRTDVAYRVEGGFGAARRDGHAGVTYQLGDIGTVALQALAFQRLYEFRLDEGTVIGLGTDTSMRVSDRVRVSGGAAIYRHVQSGSVHGVDWNQRRAHLRARWIVGSEPGSSP